MLRSAGVMRGVIATGDADPRELVEKARAVPPMEGADLVLGVTCERAFDWTPVDVRTSSRRSPSGSPSAALRIAAYDFGMKWNILRRFTALRLRRAGVSGDRARVASCWRSNPDGVFLSNGPGDPAVLAYAIENARELVEAEVPVFGICLGHQLLALALGGPTYKLKFGHRGANHPVKELETGKVEITSQNHGFAVDPESLPTDVKVTHVNLYDGTVEGLRHETKPVFCVQYHPEAAPGPHDADYLFRQFLDDDGERLTTVSFRWLQPTVHAQTTDIKRILVIGSGPIVIGQACEFDYSGTQACKALRDEGLEVILVNSNPATIMTDPEIADRTYVEPLTPEVLAQIIERERPDARAADGRRADGAQPRGALGESGTLEKYGVELIGASIAAIKVAEDRLQVQRRDARDRRRRAGEPLRRDRWTRRSRRSDASASRSIIRPSFTLGGVGGGIAYNIEEFREIAQRGLELEPGARDPGRGVGDRLEGVRARGHARRRRQLRRHLLDREHRSDGRAHRRQHHRRAGADADRQGIPADARLRRGASSAGSASRPADRTSSSPINPADGRMIVIEMNPRVSRSSALASKATGFPIAKIAAKLALGYTSTRFPNDITRLTPGVLRADDRLRRRQGAAVGVREVPAARIAR